MLVKGVPERKHILEISKRKSLEKLSVACEKLILFFSINLYALFSLYATKLFYVTQQFCSGSVNMQNLNRL